MTQSRHDVECFCVLCYFVVSLLISVVIEAVRYKAFQTDTQSGS